MIRPAHTAPTGWSDDRLMQAYDLIYAVHQANQQFCNNRAVKKILDAIEAMDAGIEDCRSDGARMADEAATVQRQQTADIIRAEQRRAA